VVSFPLTQSRDKEQRSSHAFHWLAIRVMEGSCVNVGCLDQTAANNLNIQCLIDLSF